MSGKLCLPIACLATRDTGANGIENCVLQYLSDFADAETKETGLNSVDGAAEDAVDGAAKAAHYQESD